MPGSPLGVVLLIAAVFLVIKSPLKGQMLVRMAATFAVTVLLCIVLSAVLRRGDPQTWGQVGGLIGLLAAVIAGWWHLRSVRPAA